MAQKEAELQLPVEPEVVVDVEETVLVLSSISKLLEDDDRDPQRFKQCTIYRVHEKIRNEDPGAYDPQIVSIVPYHRHHSRLVPMERLKRQFLRDLLHRHPSNTLHNYITAVSTSSFVGEASKCYSEQVVGSDSYDGCAFVEMMVIDGCFIIEFLVKSFFGEHMGELDFVNWNRSLMENDLLLLENQIPFIVIQSLFNASVIPSLHNVSPSITLVELAFSRLSRNYTQPIPDVVHHLLHLHQAFLLPASSSTVRWNARLRLKQAMNKIKQLPSDSFFWMLSLLLDCRGTPPDDEIESASRMIPRATELDEIGVKFVVKKKAKCLLDISFRDGIIEIPQIFIHTVTISKFKNLLAFEQCCPTSGSHFTSYLAFMDNLIDTAEDVVLLERSGILESKLGSDKEVAYFFNNIGKGVYLDYENHYFAGLFTEVTKYCGTETRRWRARIVRKFAVVAFVLLVLTIAQTFFTIFAYFRPS